MNPAILSAVRPAITPAQKRRAAWLGLYAILKGVESLVGTVASRVLARATAPDRDDGPEKGGAQ